MNNKLRLKKQIQQIEMQIKKINLCSNGNEVCEDLYNSLLIKKAVIKKQLDDLEKNPILEKIKSLIPRKKKLICDYFN